MCGIAGIIGLRNVVNEGRVNRMCLSLMHRGPDGQGIWSNDKKSVVLGHRRLSILDLSINGKQPMHSRDTRFSITFNGEIYNYLELRSELEKKGVSFITKTDTEVLLKLFQIHGKDCLKLLDGMFAFAIWDNLEETLFCARDRFGEKPFYYTIQDGEFVFASEMKAIFASGIIKVINNNRIAEYIQENSIVDQENIQSTFYKDVFLLEPSTFIKVDKSGIVEKGQYWNLDSITPLNISLEGAKAKFRDLFSQSIERRLRSDVNVGSSLSGGLDSSSVVRMIEVLKKNDYHQNTFSARFKDFDKDEGEFINEIINISKVNAFEVWPDADSFINELENVFFHQEEPFQSTSISAQWSVMNLARNHNTVVLLDGQGADEYLIGYHAMLNSYFQEIAVGSKKIFDEQVSAFNSLHEKQRSFSKLFRHRIKYPKLIPVFNLLARINGGRQESRLLRVNPDLIKNTEPSTYDCFDNLRDATKFSLFQNSLPKLLRYSDRNAMAHSVEVRLPFLSHELVEFVYSLPSEYKYHKGWTKRILRESMSDILPSKIAWRKDKIGYVAPQKKWMQDKRIVEVLEESKNYLTREGIISNSYSGLEWNYIMAYMTMNNNL